VAKTQDKGEPDFEQASEELHEGLKICRSVVRDYRAMLQSSPGAPGQAPHPSEPANSA
jgi:hypothetical protein